MNDQYTEEEEKFLSWFRENFKSMLIGLGAGIILVLTYKYYGDYQDEVTLNLSYEYQQAIKEYNSGNNKYLLEKDAKFSDKYPTHIYTNLINLYAAKIYMNNKDIEKALNKLDFVIANTSSNHIKNISQIRKVRILISKNELDSAFNLINKIDPKRENHILIELLGDIYYKRGNIKLAKETYSHALQFNLTPNRLQIVENKLNTIQ
jgi:predicted negative regulator of RcsB-dependent stress response|tara:strand:- start:1643 stop:2260 length:618 start_codon:yes stop_codon:yes gene_type:complete